MGGGKGGAAGDGAVTRLLEESGHADLADIKRERVTNLGPGSPQTGSRWRGHRIYGAGGP